MTKKTGCLGHIVEFTAQLYGDYNKPLKGSLLYNQNNGMFYIYILYIIFYILNIMHYILYIIW